MSRNSILKITKDIFIILSDKKEHSLNNICTRLNIQWKTAIKSLILLKELGVVVEKKGKKTLRNERLFRLR